MRDAAELVALLAAGTAPPLAFLSVGLWMLRALGLRPRGAERLALGFVLGSGAASLVILALRALDVPVPLSAVALVALAGAPVLRPSLSSAGPDAEAAGAARWVRAIDVATGLAAAVTFLAALAPETTWDGFEYHLPMVQAWTQGPIRALPAMLDSELRAGVDLLYVPAVASGQPDAAAAVSAAFAVAIALLVRAEARRRASAGAGAVAGFFVLLAPFTVDQAPSTYVDLGVGAYGFAALLFADRWNRGADGRALAVCALCLAFAANAKLHAAILVPAVAGLLLLGGRRPPWAALAAGAAAVAALTLPWFVKAALTSGNPFFPLLCEWLGYGPTTPANLRFKQLEVYYYVPVERSLPGFVGYLLAAHLGRVGALYHVSGLLGPLPLALGPLALHRLSRPTAVLLLVLAALVPLQFLFMPALRFGTPLLPFLAVAAAVGGERLARSGRLAPPVLGTALAALAVLYAGMLARDYLPRVDALDTPRAYERQVFPDQDALRRMVARAEPVVAIPKGAVSWMPKPVYNLHWSRNGELFFDRRTPPDRAWEILERRGVRSLVIDVPPGKARLGRTGHAIVDAWIAAGRARVRSDPAPLAAQQGRVWVLVELRSGPPG